MTNTWIVTTNAQIGNLVEAGRALGGTITVVAVGDAQIAGVDKVISITADADVPAEAYAGAVADAVAAGDQDVVLAPNRPAERVLAGAVAARLNAPVLSSVKKVDAEGAHVARFGGITLQTDALTARAVLIMDGGPAPEGDPVAAESVAAQAYPATVSSTESAQGERVDLTNAQRIIACGRGFKEQSELSLAQDAQLACSRPLAEGVNWFDKDRYIGVSGLTVAPDVYVAVGISGQIQHLAGMLDSKVVVAINNDKNAPIFKAADYGIVGELEQVLPQLTEALKA
ncbi:Electron transfer flavoprotein FAD-binding domain protein [Propionibacterium freudenreichii]|nr:Electron transfer flavoprotein FAD-binding domain protein [Propionibacterium freudenreichii]SCQ70888.1 Electron transfer flavoprotein FAD-binding domain protein [Propionibacterium freudenreichii]